MFTRLFSTVAVCMVFIASAAVASSSIDSRTDGYWVPQNPPKVYYKIDCSVDVEKKLLSGSELLLFENTSSRPMCQLAMKWDVRAGRTLEIKCDGKVIPFFANAEDSLVFFTPPKPILPGEKLKFECRFGNVKTAPNDLSNSSLPFVEWHPRLWWGFETHDDFDVKIAKADGYAVVSSGLLDKKTGYYHSDGVRQFGMILCKDTDIIEADANGVHIMCASTPNSQKCSRLLLDTAVDVVNFYRDRFGFYPYKCLTIVHGTPYPTGGYPVATNIVAVHGMEQMALGSKTHWQWITAHEVAHQYWFEYVLSKDPGIQNLAINIQWLMIGLGIYADREYALARGMGPEQHQHFIDYYVKGVRQGLDTTMNLSEEEFKNIKFDFSNVVNHGKGYCVISALDCTLGKDIFDKIYKRCLKEYGGRGLGVSEFRAVCESESGQDLGWFFNQWVNSNRYLRYDISSKKCEKQNDRYVSEICIRQLGNLAMPIPVAAYFEDGSSQRKFTSRLQMDSSLRFESGSPLKNVHMDPDNELAIVVPLPPVEAQLLKEIPQLPWIGSGQQALILFNKIKQANTNLTDAGLSFKLAMMLYDGKFYPESLEAFRRSQSVCEKIPPLYFGCRVWQGHLLDLMGRREEAVKCYKNILETVDPNLMIVRHDQYGMELNKAWVEERIKKPFERVPQSPDWSSSET